MKHTLVAIVALLVVATSIAPEAGAQQRLSPDWRVKLHRLPELAWQPRNPATPVLASKGKRLLVASAGGLHSLQPTHGAIQWHHKTGEAVAGSPLVVGKLAYIVTSSGNVSAIRVADGTSLWKKPTMLGAVVHAGLSTDGKRLFAVSDPATVTAIDRATGRVTWRFGVTVTREFLVEGHGAALVHKGVVFAGLANGKLVALASRDGGSVWSVSLGNAKAGPYVDIDTTPVIGRDAGKDLIVAASHNAGLYGLKAADGGRTWRYVGEGLGQPVIAGGLIYTVAPAGVLHVVRLHDGKRVFARRLVGSPSGQLAIAGDTLLIPSAGGLQVVSRATGAGIWTVVDGFGFAAAPLVVGDHVFAVANGGLAWGMRRR